MNNQINKGGKRPTGLPAILSKAGVILIGIYLIFLAFFLVYLFVNFWPVENATQITDRVNPTETEQAAGGEQTGESQDQSKTPSPPSNQEAQEDMTVPTDQDQEEKNHWKKEVRILWLIFEVSYEIRLIILVLLAGALGSYVHVVSSYMDYVGNKKFVGSWTWWYFLRPLSGSVLALIFYFIVRGGLFSTQIQGSELSRFGIAGLAGLVGLFSNQAIDKLSEIFDIVFSTKEKVKREDSLGKKEE